MELSLLVAGDFCPRDRMIPLLGQKKLLTQDVTSLIKDSDILSGLYNKSKEKPND